MNVGMPAYAPLGTTYRLMSIGPGTRSGSPDRSTGTRHTSPSIPPAIPNHTFDRARWPSHQLPFVSKPRMRHDGDALHLARQFPAPRHQTFGGFLVDVTITINGQQHTYDVEPRTLLVHYIREHAGLTGTNIGCDTSSCGACSVHLNGEAAKSCTVLAAQADGMEITTIEGMATADGTLHPMQQAFMENHGLQCGYCTPGMVMAATSLLDENPSPTEDEVRIGLEGNLCRCTGYHNIVKSVLAAADA